MSYKLDKPFTQQQKNEFLEKYNRDENMLRIEETDTALYALEPNEIMVDGEPVIDPEYETKQAQIEQQRISMLSLTAADVERGIYKATGKDFDDVVALVEQVIASGSVAIQIDIKALKIELKANNFYRGNPYVDAVGTLLGFTKGQLDKFFEDGNYEHLLAVEDESI